MQGGFDLPGFTRAVCASGYRGPLSLEVFNDVFRQADPRRTAVDAMRSLIALEDAVAELTGGPVLRRGDWVPGVVYPQHITLATRDITRTAAALADAKAPLLPIPDNYYDDLAARVDIEPKMLAFLRQVGAMYDEDSSGSYVQLFTPIIGSRLFFEISQRMADYQGYGTANDPVRMAAHRTQRLATGSSAPLRYASAAIWRRCRARGSLPAA
jgi:hypothetical protein